MKPDQGNRNSFVICAGSAILATMDTAKLSKIRRLTANGSAKAIRMAADVSLPEISDELDIPYSTLWRWENGQRTPHGEPAERYADLLDRLVAS